MTLGHICILSATGMLAGPPTLLSIISQTSPGAPAHHLLIAIAGALIGWPVLLLACYRFVFGAAGPDHRFDWRGTLKRGAAILALQIGLTFFTAFAIADRPATLREGFMCAACAVALESISIFIARQFGVWRRPFDEWLTLDIAA